MVRGGLVRQGLGTAGPGTVASGIEHLRYIHHAGFPLRRTPSAAEVNGRLEIEISWDLLKSFLNPIVGKTKSPKV